MSDHTTTKSFQMSFDHEDSFLTALSSADDRTTEPTGASTKMFMITDTSSSSPLIKRRSMHSSPAQPLEKKQMESPVSYTSAVTHSPAVSQSATSNDNKTVHNRVTFHSGLVHSSTSIALAPSDSLSPNSSQNQQKCGAVGARSLAAPTAQPPKASALPHSVRHKKHISFADNGVHESGTSKRIEDRSSTMKPRKSITAGFTPPPSKIPTRKRRTPSYARSTKASRRRLDWTKVSSAPKHLDEHESVPKVRKLDFSKTIPVSPEVLHRKTGRIRKVPSPRKSLGFQPNPPPRYLGKPRPTVRPTAKSEAVLAGRARTAPVWPTPSFSVRKPGRTEAKPFSLASVELHEICSKKFQAKRKMEEQEDRRRRNVQPVKLHHDILKGPTFVPNLDNKVLTVPVDPVPWASERRKRTLAFEAAQRARVEEMDAMREQAERMREIADEERLREEYELKRFRARPVPRSHYNPDTPPKRRAFVAVMQTKEKSAREIEVDVNDELESIFSNLAINGDTETTLTFDRQDEKVRRCVSLRATDRKDLYSIVEETPIVEESSEHLEIVQNAMAVNEAEKENIVPRLTKNLEMQKASQKQPKRPSLGPIRLFNEIRNTLFGR